LLTISIPLELWVSYEVGMGLRALLAYIIVVHGCGLWNFPGRSSPLSWCIWTSGWLLTLGYAVAALSPEYRLTGLHIVFIGGFTLGPLSFALSWIFVGNSGLQQRFDRVLPIGLFSGFLVLSLLLRSMGEGTADRLVSWGYSTMAYILSVVIWMYLVLKVLWLRSKRD
jgi:hypothetical protein